MRLITPIIANFNVGGDETYKLMNDFLFEYDGLGTIKVPAGFITDLASIPDCVFWWGRGIWDFGALPHDYGYEKGGLIVDNEFVELTRKELDDIFLKINLHMGQNIISAYAMYWAVRIYNLNF